MVLPKHTPRPHAVPMLFSHAAWYAYIFPHGRLSSVICFCSCAKTLKREVTSTKIMHRAYCSIYHDVKFYILVSCFWNRLDFTPIIDGDSRFCYTRFSEQLFFGYIGTVNPKTWQKQELFANFSGLRIWTHNPKVAGSSPAPAIKKGTEKVPFL